MEETVSYRTCPLCEATCGLEIRARGREVVSIRGDEEDVFSKGFLCPKAYALKELDADPDRLRTPLVRKNGKLEPATWDEAFELIEKRYGEIVAAHGRDAVAVFLGNPSAHVLALGFYNQVFLRALGTRNIYSASTVDQMPKQVSGGLMFGTVISFPVPDLDRAKYVMMLGANPFESNGSLMTSPDVPGKLKDIVKRGGKVVVVDPRRTRTAEHATEYVALRPGTDALFLAAILNVLFEEGLANPGAMAAHVAGLEDVRAFVRDFTPERVAERCAVEAKVIRRLARELASADPSVVYGRIGTTTQEFGTLASWLVDVVNVLTGSLDRPGGPMFPKPASGGPNTRGTPGKGKGVRFGRRRSRVRDVPEVYGELPCACLAEEIETPGDGQIRALFTVSGNPVLSTPNGARLAKALDTLEFMVSLDIYVNETASHADVVLPGLSALEQSHYDLFLRQFAVRNVATYSPAMFAMPEGQQEEWKSLLRLTAIITGQGANADLEALDDFVAAQVAESAARAAGRSRRRHPRRGRAAARTGAAPRHRAPERTLRRQLRSREGGPLARRAREEPARYRSRPARAADSGSVADAVGEDRARARGAGRGWRASARGAGPRRGCDGADRPARSPLQQLVDAQPERARERKRALYAAGLAGGRRASRARGRRARAGGLTGRRGRSAGRGYGPRDARCRQLAARLGTRRRGSAHDDRRGTRRRELEPARRRARARSALGQRDPQRDSGEGRSHGLTTALGFSAPRDGAHLIVAPS